MRKIMTVGEYNAKQTNEQLKYSHTTGYVVGHYGITVGGGDIFQYCATMEEAEQLVKDGIDY